MKSVFFTLFFLPLIVFSQNDFPKKIYLDSLWKETTAGNHKYYRIVESFDSEKKLYKIKDYYKSGVLQMVGHSKTEKDTIFSREGEFIFYYENGNKQRISNYYNSHLLGKDEQWYENGTKQSEWEYFEYNKNIPIPCKLNQYWNPDGKQTVINGNGHFEDSSEDYSDSGNIKNGLKEGTWKGIYNKKNKYTEVYKKGILISGVSTDGERNEYKYNELETMPKPKEGIQNFYQYIGKNFNVPKEFENLKGRIFTTFIVDKDGQIVEPKTVKSVNEVLDQEAIRVITSYEKWIPAKQRGQYVRVLYSIPITLAGNK